MNNKLKKSIGSVAAFFAVSVPLVFAGTESSPQSGHSSQKAARASSVTGLEVVSSDGTDIGTIKDFVVSLDGGQIESVIVGTGFLGIGGPAKIIDYGEMNGVKSEDSTLTSKLSHAEIGDLKEFDERSLKTSWESGPRIRKGEFEAMNFVYSDVESKDGNHLGEVEDWIIDVDDARVTHVIIRQSDFLAPYGFSYFAVGASNFEGVRSGDLVVDITEEDLDNATDLDESKGALSLRDADSQIFQFSYHKKDLAMSK